MYKFRITTGVERKEKILAVFSHPQTILIAICRYPQRAETRGKEQR